MTMRNYKLQVIHRWFTTSNNTNKGNASLVLEGMASPKALNLLLALLQNHEIGSSDKLKAILKRGIAGE